MREGDAAAAKPVAATAAAWLAPDGVTSRWLPVVAWAALISLLSSGYFSGEQTGGVLLPLLELVLPGMSAASLDVLHAGVRKLAHVTEYAVLAILLVRALDRPQRAVATTATASLLVGTAYAALDELHQSWVPSRVGSPFDVALDAFGTLLGVALAIVLSAGRRSRA